MAISDYRLLTTDYLPVVILVLSLSQSEEILTSAKTLPAREAHATFGHTENRRRHDTTKRLGGSGTGELSSVAGGGVGEVRGPVRGEILVHRSPATVRHSPIDVLNSEFAVRLANHVG